MVQTANSALFRPGTTGLHLALLRGINVGGKNKLPMAELVAMFVEAGCADVRTYIQSGNVLFTVAPSRRKELADVITKRIAEHFGFRVPVILRTADELRQTVAGNPFLKSGVDTAAFHVAFLADAPPKRLVAALDIGRSPGDSFDVRGREIYLCLPNGVAKTKLTNAYFDSTLATVSTLRNWRTVLKLAEMAQAVS